MKVLSLFDGISCGRVAFERAGIPVERYTAFEIDKYAIQVSRKNYPDIEHRGNVFDGDYTAYRGFDIGIGGSPCTKWSIARNNRETSIDGEGGALFRQYARALYKSNVSYFIYENNYSIHQNIKDAISAELGVKPMMINSALVSAQSRKRCYWTNIPVKGLPTDKGILLKDILESGIVNKEKAYCLKSHEGNTRDYFKKRHTQIAFEKAVDVGIVKLPHGFNKGSVKCDGKAPTMTANGEWQYKNLLCEPLRVGTIEHTAELAHDSKQYRVYSPEGKSTTLCGQGGGVGAKTGLYAVPINTIGDKSRTLQAHYARAGEANLLPSHPFKESAVAIPCGTNFIDKARTLISSYGEKVGQCDMTYDFITHGRLGHTGVFDSATSSAKRIYEVKDGLITIKDKQYPIKLPDGLYTIRKLTPVECERLQTLPDNYTAGVSDTQRYKALGNGWTVDVIAFILSFLKEGGDA
jgi:DNA (cytosine-5)-methyltransferase 3A